MSTAAVTPSPAVVPTVSKALILANVLYEKRGAIAYVTVKPKASVRQPAARNGIFAAGDWRAESASKTMSPRKDRKSETTMREKWPQKRPFC